MKKLLLCAGIVGPLLFIAVFLVEGFTRPGYSQWRHYVSQLATGPGGWIQVANFLMCGSLVLLFAVGLRLSTSGTRGSIGGPLLLGLFAVDLLVAGLFSTDPGLGYPPGTALVHTTHGFIHGMAGLGAFSLLPAASFVMAWHFGANRDESRWSVYSLLVGLVIVVGFFVFTTVSAMDAAGALPNAPTGFLQRVVIITGWTWMALVAWHQLRVTAQGSARS